MIMLVDDEEGVLRYMAAVGEEPEVLKALDGYEIPLSRTENILVRVALNGRPVVAEEASLYNLNPENVIIRNFKPDSFVLLPLTARGKIIGILAADRSKSDSAPSVPDEEFLNGFANQVAMAIENARMYQGLREGFLSTIQALASAIEAKDPYTRGHSERVTQYSVRLAKLIGLSERQVEHIRNMCLIHDIGKIGIDRGLLNKKARLESYEFELIRQHPLIGEMIIKPLNLSPEEMTIVRHHHERFDGLGYPDRLKGEEIPIEVRVVSLCDAFDAMSADRPYRRALPQAEVLREIEKEAGRQFDPDLVAVFVNLIRRGRIIKMGPDKAVSRQVLTSYA